MAFLRGSPQSYLIVLCAKTITIHRSSDLELLMTVPLQAATCFAVNEGLTFPGLAVAESSTLYLYNLQFGFDVCKPFALPEQPVSMTWMKDYVVVAYRDEYSLVSEVNGSVQELAYTDGAAPLCRTLPMEEVMVITKSGALIAQPHSWKVSAYKLSPPVRSIAFSFPYIFALSTSGSECSVEIRSLIDVSYHEILRLPAVINGKHHVSLADDQLNIFILDHHHIYALLPNPTTALQSTGQNATEPSQHSSLASASTPSSPIRTSSSSSKNTQIRTPTTEGIFSFKTTIASGTPTKLPSSSPTSSPRSQYSPYYIPPPSPSDKNAFIRYIRTVLKQDSNPYRILLNSYAEKIISDIPNPATARLDDVKRLVTTYLRRFLRTFSLEFKQFQSKSNRELLTIAVSIVLHSLIYSQVFAMIQAQSEAQDKQYNAKLLSLHTKPFHPSQFEIRPKFWLTVESIIAEEEKDNARRSMMLNAAHSRSQTREGALSPDNGNTSPSIPCNLSGTDEDSSVLSEDRMLDANNGQLGGVRNLSSPDSSVAGDISSNSLKRYFSSIETRPSNDDGMSSGSSTTDGEEYAIDFRPTSANIGTPQYLPPHTTPSSSLPHHSKSNSPLGSANAAHGDSVSKSVGSNSSVSASTASASNRTSPSSHSDSIDKFGSALKRGEALQGSHHHHHQQQHRPTLNASDLSAIGESGKASTAGFGTISSTNERLNSAASTVADLGQNERFPLGAANLYNMVRVRSNASDLGASVRNVGVETDEESSDSVSLKLTSPRSVQDASSATRTSVDPSSSSTSSVKVGEFKFLDLVTVSYDSDHHLYFTFAKMKLEKELAPHEWNFTFKDEERSVYWEDSTDGTVWRLAFVKRPCYLEFTTRYRLYEQSQQHSALGTSSASLSASSMGTSFSQPSFLLGSFVSPSSLSNSHQHPQQHQQQSASGPGQSPSQSRERLFSSGSQVDFGAMSPPPTSPSSEIDPLILEQSLFTSNSKIESPASVRAESKRVDLRRLAMEQSALTAAAAVAATTSPLSSSSTSNSSSSSTTPIGCSNSSKVSPVLAIVMASSGSDSPRFTALTSPTSTPVQPSDPIFPSSTPSSSAPSTPLSSMPSSPVTMTAVSASSASSSSITPTTTPTLSAPHTHDYPYCAAVRTLRLVPKARTPREKIENMARALSYVAQAVDEFWAPHGKKVIVGADDLVPIFSYVVAMARIPNIYSEMAYTMEFSNESSLRGKYGYSIATLQICVEHVIQVSAQLESERLEAAALSSDASADTSSQQTTENTTPPKSQARFAPVSPSSPSTPSPTHSSSKVSSTATANASHHFASATVAASSPSPPSPSSLSPSASPSSSTPGSGKMDMRPPTMRVQDLMGKMESMSKMNRGVEENFGERGPSPPPPPSTSTTMNATIDAQTGAIGDGDQQNQMLPPPSSRKGSRAHRKASIWSAATNNTNSTINSNGVSNGGGAAAAAVAASSSTTPPNNAAHPPASSPAILFSDSRHSSSLSERGSKPSPPHTIDGGRSSASLSSSSPSSFSSTVSPSSSSSSSSETISSPTTTTTPPAKRSGEPSFNCSALEVSQPQIDGSMWVNNRSIHFEGMFKKQKRYIKVDIAEIMALKKSWGLFGGEGIDIYATKDRIVFLRHFTDKNRDAAYQAIEREVAVAGITLQQPTK